MMDKKDKQLINHIYKNASNKLLIKKLIKAEEHIEKLTKLLNKEANKNNKTYII